MFYLIILIFKGGRNSRITIIKYCVFDVTSRSMTIEHDVHTNVLLEPTFCMFPQQEHVFDVYDSFTCIENWYILEPFSLSLILNSGSE